MEKPCLVVESIPAVQRALENLLKTSGCKNVLTTNSVEKAKTQLAQNPSIAALVVDWDSTEPSGFDFYKDLQSKGALADKRFILSFKKKSKEQILEAIQKGVHGFLVKPFTLETVKKMVAELAKYSESTEPEPAASQANASQAKG